MEETIENHNENIENLFKRLRTVGMTLNSNKTEQLQTKVSYYGHLLTSQGLQAAPSKSTTISKMAVPINKKKLVFFGHEPLRLLTHEKWGDWTSEREGVFKALKDMITRAPVLTYFNADEPIVLQCDASSKGLVNVGGKRHRRHENHIKQTSHNQTTELSTIEKKPQSARRVRFAEEITADEVQANNSIAEGNKEEEENITEVPHFTQPTTKARKSERIRRPPARYGDFV
ncbi:RNase H-like domain found in reverse transcriptase [Popillia japonica]|uniref:RNase H-like domain found in reverse transcriptase n=1 Tax=Popillia japonica TaxID=7064 RepID=A0AAW1JJ19_POPJA